MDRFCAQQNGTLIASRFCLQLSGLYLVVDPIHEGPQLA